MSTHTFKMPTEFVGPGNCIVPGELEITFDHQRADPDVGMPEGVYVESIVVLIGTGSMPYDGSHDDVVILDACREHFEQEKEAAECVHADFLRDQRLEACQ